MATDKITVRNTLNGLVTTVSSSILDNPHLAQHLVVVPEDAKPLILHTPTTAEEFQARRAGFEKSKGKKNLKSEDTDNPQEG